MSRTYFFLSSIDLSGWNCYQWSRLEVRVYASRWCTFSPTPHVRFLSLNYRLVVNTSTQPSQQSGMSFREVPSPNFCRITHLPTGINAKSQQERSQHQVNFVIAKIFLNFQNKKTALKILSAKLKEHQALTSGVERDGSRKKQVFHWRFLLFGILAHVQIGTGDRSERIRTYNFPQDRITE